MQRRRALVLALVVTVLWSTSFVLQKVALRAVGPLWLAALRYESAGVLLALVSFPQVRTAIRAVGLLRVFALGVLGYAISQGPFVFGLSRLPASATLLIGTVTSVILVTALGVVFLAERPTLLAGLGIGLTVAGLALYAGVEPIGALDAAGAAAVTFSSLGYGGWLVLGRHLVRAVPPPDLVVVAIVAWLAVVNTAVAFSLWTESQRALRAYESNILSNLVLVEASLLALVFLGEPLGRAQWAGIALVLAGVMLTQLRARGPRPVVPEEVEEPA